MTKPPIDSTMEKSFAEVMQLIQSAKQTAVKSVNAQLVDLYWQVGAYISQKLEKAEWGDGIVPQLAAYLAKSQPGLRGFTPRNLFRMRQFYEAYRNEEKLTPLVSQLPWTQNLIILNQSKRPEEREFYLRLAIQEKWSKRELERQFKVALFERSVLNPVKLSPVVERSHPTLLPNPNRPRVLRLSGLGVGRWDIGFFRVWSWVLHRVLHRLCFLAIP